MQPTILLSLLLLSLGSVALTACNPSPETQVTPPTVVKKYTQAVTLEGKVSNNQGILKTGKVVAKTEQGRVLAETAVDEGNYQLTIPAETVLPLVLSYTGAASSEELLSVVIHDSIRHYAINPTTTAIAKAAKAMGGYSSANMTHAAQKSVHSPDENKTTSGWRGDPTSQYGGWH